MLHSFTVLLSIIVPLLSAPQNSNFYESSNVKIFVKPTTPEASTDIKKVAEEISPITSKYVADLSQIQERDGESKSSNFAVINEGFDADLTIQNPDEPISLDDDFDTSNANSAFPSSSFNDLSSFESNQGPLPVFGGDPSSFSGGDQDIFPPFGPGPNIFPQQQFGIPLAAPNQFSQSPLIQPNGFGNQPPFAFQQAPRRPLLPFQRPEILDDEEDASENDEGGGKKRISFLQSLFTF